MAMEQWHCLSLYWLAVSFALAVNLSATRFRILKLDASLYNQKRRETMGINCKQCTHTNVGLNQALKYDILIFHEIYHICISVRLYVITLYVYNGFDLLLSYTLFTLFFHLFRPLSGPTTAYPPFHLAYSSVTPT